MMFPVVTELADDGVPVTVSCRVLDLCRQQYYRWTSEPFTDAELDEAWLANAVFDAHRDDPEFGYRFLADELRRLDEYHEVSDRTVWRICRENSWWCSFAKTKNRKASQFRARKVARCLARHRMVGSMGQVGTAADNAAMESFFALLQRNVLDTRRWTSRDELRIAIVTWIERTYHQRRRQAALGRLTPTEYETIMTPQTALAA